MNPRSAGRIETCQWRQFIRDQRSSVIVTVVGSLIGTALLISGTVKLQAEIEAFLGMMPTSRGSRHGQPVCLRSERRERRCGRI